jgi:hypothetical protein
MNGSKKVEKLATKESWDLPSGTLKLIRSKVMVVNPLEDGVMAKS